MPWTGKPSPTQWRFGALDVERTFLAVVMTRIWCRTAKASSTGLPERRKRAELALVDVAPAPNRPELARLHHGVSGFMEMRRRVLSRRAVAAAYVPARQAGSKLHPFLAAREALLAPVRARCRVRLSNSLEMLTGRHPC